MDYEEVLAALKTERAQVAAKGQQAEAEAAPMRYVAELVGSSDQNSEQAIRWLILMMGCAAILLPSS